MIDHYLLVQPCLSLGNIRLLGPSLKHIGATGIALLQFYSLVTFSNFLLSLHISPKHIPGLSPPQDFAIYPSSGSLGDYNTTIISCCPRLRPVATCPLSILQAHHQIEHRTSPPWAIPYLQHVCIWAISLAMVRYLMLDLTFLCTGAPCWAGNVFPGVSGCGFLLRDWGYLGTTEDGSLLHLAHQLHISWMDSR